MFEILTLRGVFWSKNPLSSATGTVQMSVAETYVPTVAGLPATIEKAREAARQELVDGSTVGLSLNMAMVVGVVSLPDS